MLLFYQGHLCIERRCYLFGLIKYYSFYYFITTDRQNLNFVGFYFYLFVYQLLAVFIFVLLKTYPLSK